MGGKRKKPFDVNLMKWSMWFGFFEATIHNQPISETEKLTHLQTLMTGKAIQAITGYYYNSTMYNAVFHDYDDDMDELTSSSMTLSTEYRASSNHQLNLGIRTWSFPHSSLIWLKRFGRLGSKKIWTLQHTYNLRSANCNTISSSFSGHSASSSRTSTSLISPPSLTV